MTFEEWYRSVDDDCGFDDCKIRDVAAKAWFAAVENIKGPRIKNPAERSEGAEPSPSNNPVND